MGHPHIENRTRFSFEALYAINDECRTAAAFLVQATYVGMPVGLLTLADSQVPIQLAGERYYPDAEESSYKYEPQVALTKAGTDVVLIGHACHSEPVREVVVRLTVGSLKKTAIVFGDRYWTKSLGSISKTEAIPFERMPLVYERAFGGWDRSQGDESKHSFEPRNPVGTGYRSRDGKFEDGVRLPNVEDPSVPIRDYYDTPAPTGFGFISHGWQPRLSYAGTYDERWSQERIPLIPIDFDVRYYNAASPGLVTAGHLRGDEPVLVENASPMGTLRFNLPGTSAPVCTVVTVGKNRRVLQTMLDTVIINTDENFVLLIWRASMPLRRGPHDLLSIEIVG